MPLTIVCPDDVSRDFICRCCLRLGLRCSDPTRTAESVFEPPFSRWSVTNYYFVYTVLLLSNPGISYASNSFLVSERGGRELEPAILFYFV